MSVQFTKKPDACIPVNQLDLEDQYNRLEKLQQLLFTVRRILDELHHGEHDEAFIRAVLEIVCNSVETAGDSYADQAICYSQKQRGELSKALGQPE
jgi:hypothetical protein